VATANAAAWALSYVEIAWAMPAALTSAMAVAAAAAWRARRGCAPGELAWDGAQWQWRQTSGQADVTLDLGGWMLLTFKPVSGGRIWIPASHRSAIGPWSALRTALYARRPADPPDAPPA
jgi:hypothetical protein